MANYELYLPPERKSYNAKTGHFLKGHTPWNKGKKWSDYLSKRVQRRMAKGWKNLDKYRPTFRPDTAGRCRKQVIAVLDDGKWLHFSYIGSAAEWCGGLRENIGRCCRLNESKAVLRGPHGKPTGKVNTDHRYKGVRWYFESDDVWTEKVR